ncbi:putative dipeptidase B [Aerococcus christensenii]|uniref:Dipeptidase n=2 Tax=Aerococcus christensenii TaxID=87541 RepID=A0A133XZ36_9LACT|nr:putative dipeptidase B [Aerococcus christensenii]
MFRKIRQERNIIMIKESSCTTILVGKKASLNGSTLIARNEDGGDRPDPQRFVVVSPEDQPSSYKTFKGNITIELPECPGSYTSTPEADVEHNGLFAGSGINQWNVAMSATETITTNPRVLAVDPYVPGSIVEADMVTLVLPYIHSAKEGVLRMGELLEEYGTYEANGMAFSDSEEIWYMETYGGHHWAAIRIPDECYVVAPNRLNIDQFDFESDQVLYCTDLQAFIEENQLNPDSEGLNLRHTLGSDDYKDVQYNNPRTWYVQKHFSDLSRPYTEDCPFVDDPAYPDQPFLCYPKRKLSVEDIKWALSSHYEGTVYDIYGKMGTEEEKHRYRAIGLNRNMEVHCLEIRPQLPTGLQGVHWLAFASNAYNCLLPFYSYVKDTPASWRDTPISYNPNYMYWLVQTMAVIGDRDYSLYGTLQNEFEKSVMAKLRRMQVEIDQEVKSMTDQEAIKEKLTVANQTMADFLLQASQKQLGQLVEVASTKMDLRFNLKD